LNFFINRRRHSVKLPKNKLLIIPLPAEHRKVKGK